MDDKVKRLMDHTNIDEETAENALEKNNNNVLDAFAYLEQEKLIDKKLSHKQVNHDKNYVDYNSDYRYMDEKIMGNSPVYPNPFKNESGNKKKNSYEDFNYSFNVESSPNYGHYDTKKTGYVNPEKYKEYTNPDFKVVGNQMARGFSSVIKYLVSNKLVVMRKNNAMISVPIILAIIVALLLVHWLPIVIGVFFVSLILGFRYFIESPDVNNKDGENNYDLKYNNEDNANKSQYRTPNQTYGRHAPYQNHNIQNDKPVESATMDKKEYYEKMEDYAGGSNILNTDILRKQILETEKAEIEKTVAVNEKDPMEKALDDLEIKTEEFSQNLEENIEQLEEEIDKIFEEEKK